MKGIIEQEIEKYAERTGEYPKTVRVSPKEYDILQKELSKEYYEIYNRKNSQDFSSFRGCQLIKDRKLSKFIVEG